MFTSYLKKIEQHSLIEVTPLRRDIIKILYQAKSPIGAYDVLEVLKKARPNAKPPTVYRVLDYLINANIIHKIDSSNTYTCCKVESTCSNSIILTCKSCKKITEIPAPTIIKKIKSISKDSNFQISHNPIAINGLCKKCSHK